MQRKIFAVLALVGILSCSPQAHDPSPAEAIQSFAARTSTSRGAPGVVVAVVRDGEVVGRGVFGVSDTATQTAVTASTPFQLASATKPFTATGVLLLVADGRFGLDDPIGGLLPGLPSAWRLVTVRQLLSHTSGLPDVTRTPGQLDLIANTWDEAFAIIRTAPMQFAPGERWAYTQTNYVLLTQIIERVSGMPFERFMDERMFTPLQMTSTFFPTDEAGARACAVNYETDAQGQVVRRSLSFPAFVHGAGGLCSSVDDLIRWNAALDGGSFLSLELLQAMWTPITLNDGSVASVNGAIGYGLGWAIDTTDGRRSAGHSGGNAAAFRRLVDQHLTVIVLHNGLADPDGLVTALADVVLNPGDNPQAQLWDGAAAGDVAAVEAALNAGADVNALDTRTSRNGRRALNWAAIGNKVPVIELLVARGASVNEANNSGFTPLHHAAEAGAVEATQALLAAGADRTLRNADGATASEVAQQNDHAALAALIGRAL